LLTPAKLVRRLRKRRTAFQITFDNEHGRDVLAELLDYVGWRKDLSSENAITMANLLGRRAVVLHILAILDQTDEEIDRIIQVHGKSRED
jgi:hypothetical protein